MKTIGQIAYEAWCHAGRQIAANYANFDKYDRLRWELMATAVVTDANARPQTHVFVEFDCTINGEPSKAPVEFVVQPGCNYTIGKIQDWRGV